MIRNVSTDDTDFPRWRRAAAFAINALISRLETPQVNDVRYNPATPGLEYYDGTTWLPA